MNAKLEVKEESKDATPAQRSDFMKVAAEHLQGLSLDGLQANSGPNEIASSGQDCALCGKNKVFKIIHFLVGVGYDVGCMHTHYQGNVLTMAEK